jgi:hypothetical protein
MFTYFRDVGVDKVSGANRKKEKMALNRAVFSKFQETGEMLLQRPLGGGIGGAPV